MIIEVSDIVARVKGLTLGQNLTEGLVESFIVEETNIVNGIVSNQYQIPVDENDSPISHGIITTCVIHKVLKRMELFLKTSTGVQETTQAVTDYMKRNDESNMLVKQIMKGSLNLPDAKRRGNKIYTSFGIKKYSLGRDDW